MPEINKPWAYKIVLIMLNYKKSTVNIFLTLWIRRGCKSSPVSGLLSVV